MSSAVEFLPSPQSLLCGRTARARLGSGLGQGLGDKTTANFVHSQHPCSRVKGLGGGKIKGREKKTKSQRAAVDKELVGFD